MAGEEQVETPAQTKRVIGIFLTDGGTWVFEFNSTLLHVLAIRNWHFQSCPRRRGWLTFARNCAKQGLHATSKLPEADFRPLQVLLPNYPGARHEIRARFPVFRVSRFPAQLHGLTYQTRKLICNVDAQAILLSELANKAANSNSKHSPLSRSQ